MRGFDVSSHHLCCPRQQQQHSSSFSFAKASSRHLTRVYTSHPLCPPSLPQPLPGNVPRAAWQWQSGTISRQLFDSVPFILRDKPVQDGGHDVPCQHCTFVLRYKVIGGQLYTDSKRRCVCVLSGCVGESKG